MLFRSIVLVFALVGFCRVNAAYPDRPIRLIAPFAPGGNIDITARTVSPGLTEQLGQPVVVENRGGAGGRIGTELVAKSLPDGYTLLLGSSGSLTVNPSFSTTTSYDPIKDFAPTSLVSIVPLVLVVHPSMPVMMASAGSGSNTHLTGELFQITVGIKLTHVPYKGSGPALVDLLGGQTHCIFDQVSTSASYVNMGKLRALAVASNKRSQSLSSIPTMEQAGVKGFEAATYTGIFLPAGTSKEIVNRIYSALLRVLELPSTRDAFNRLGAEVVSSTPEELSLKLSQDLMKWRKVQLQTGIRLN